MTEPACSLTVLSAKRERRRVMIELEDGIQSRPGFASMAIGASQEEGAVR